jgi:hypothetical protein
MKTCLISDTVSLYSHFFSSMWQMQTSWSVTYLSCLNPHWWSPVIQLYWLNLEMRILMTVICLDNSYSQFYHPSSNKKSLYFGLYNICFLFCFVKIVCVTTFWLWEAIFRSGCTILVNINLTTFYHSTSYIAQCLYWVEVEVLSIHLIF